MTSVILSLSKDQFSLFDSRRTGDDAGPLTWPYAFANFSGAMGYELRITRKEQWYDEGPSISHEEWKMCIGDDPEAELFYSDASGSIAAKNPNKQTCIKMYQLALKLGAKVQGDEGEIYDANGVEVGRSRTEVRWGALLVIVLVLATGVFAILAPATKLLVPVIVALAVILLFILIFSGVTFVFVSFAHKSLKHASKYFKR